MIARVRDVEPRTWAMTVLMVVCFAGMVLAVVAGEWLRQVVVASSLGLPPVVAGGCLLWRWSLEQIVIEDEAALLRQNKGDNG